MTDEAQRQRVLDSYRIVDSLPEDAYQDIVQIAAALCDTPIALLSLVDRDRQWFKARMGLEVSQTERSQAVCGHAIREPQQLLEVPDLAADPRFADIAVVRGDTGARFYAGMPLVTDEGIALGTVCVLDTTPRELQDAQRDGLRALARTAMRLLDARRDALQREREALLQAHPVADSADAEGRYWVVMLEVQELAALAERQSERLLGSSLQQLDRALGSYVQDGGADSVDRATDSAEFIVMLHGADAERKLRGLREIAARQQALGLTVLVGAAQATRADEQIGLVFLRAEAALSAEKDRLRPQTP
ncbi:MULTISPECIES: GAF domain-containing protein [Xanthomonas]|uniref:GAF domain-containing protein n=1 Tax=Xanthomonas indica TaxID=2912242 RepID=A0AAU8I8D0_9XANT|nr:GAF domain-containing protein [Xanthomonas indica]MCI2261510.1 GAF domain-containing protein [Xanthomonas indica]